MVVCSRPEGGGAEEGAGKFQDNYFVARLFQVVSLHVNIYHFPGLWRPSSEISLGPLHILSQFPIGGTIPLHVLAERP